MSLDVKELWDSYLAVIDRTFSRRPKAPVVGIDIGTSAVKAAVIAPGSGGGITLEGWAVERIEGNDVKGALARALERVKFADQVPVTAVSGKGTLIRYMDMPRMPLEDLRASFVYDLDKYFPFDPQSIYTDCFILDDKAKDKRMPVLVAAVKKEIVDERLLLFKEAGVALAQVTINSIAVANAFERLGPAVSASGNAKAVLDIGGSVSSLLIIKDMVPCFTRDIFIGSQEMTRQIANVLGVAIAQAEELKCRPGERAAEVTAACEAAVGHLVSEIRLSLDYFITEKNVQIDEFFLLGGGSLLKGIETVFEKNLGIQVKTWDPLVNIHLGPDAAADIRAFSSQMGAAVGLACLPAGIAPMIDINLLPLSSRKKTAGGILSVLPLDIPREVFLGVGVGCIGLLVLVHALLLGAMAVEGAAWAGYRAMWQGILPDKNRLDILAGESMQIRKKMGGLNDTASAKGSGWPRRLNIISDGLGKGVWLRRIAFDDKALVIEGSAISRDKDEVATIGSFVDALKKDEFFMRDFAGMEVNSVQREKKGATDVANFTVTAKLK